MRPSDHAYFGDAFADASGTDDNTFDGFAGLWGGPGDLTNHALYREYANTAGRWMSPDTYTGSYDLSNPQSFNRYSYVLNNPLAFTDPTGQAFCGVSLAVDGGLSGPIGWIGLGECVFLTQPYRSRL